MNQLFVFLKFEREKCISETVTSPFEWKQIMVAVSKCTQHKNVELCSFSAEKRGKIGSEICVYDYICVFPQKKVQRWVGWGGGEEKTSSKRLAIAAHLGIGSGTESRDWGQGEVCEITKWEDVWMLLYHLKWRGLLGYEGWDQMLLESKQNLSRRYGIRKKKADDNYLFKRKPPSVSEHKAHCENSTLPPKRLHIVKPCKFDHISHLLHTEKKQTKQKNPKHFSCWNSLEAPNTCGYRLQMSYLIVASKVLMDVWTKQICCFMSF